MIYKWFNRLFSFILPDFLPKVIIYGIIVFLLAGKPKLLKKAYDKMGRDEKLNKGWLVLYMLMWVVLVVSVWCCIGNILLIIINMIPGINM